MLKISEPETKYRIYTGGIREPLALPIEPTAASDKTLFLSRSEVEEARVMGALMREPELVRYTIPVPVLGLGRMAPPAGRSVLSGGGERGIDERMVDWEVEEDKTDGTGTAARSLPLTLEAWRGSCNGRTGEPDGEVGEGADDVEEKVRVRGNL